jgi:hypothetical protein
VHVKIVIKVREDVVMALDKDPKANEAALELLEAAREQGVELKKMHPIMKDTVLASYYIAEVADQNEAERLVESFRVCRGTEAVYIKPPNDLP